MCKKYKVCEPILLENIDSEGICEFVEQTYEIQLIPRFINKLAVETKGCFKCFASRLQNRLANERFGENAVLYHTWPKDFAKSLEKYLQTGK